MPWAKSFKELRGAYWQRVTSAAEAFEFKSYGVGFRVSESLGCFLLDLTCPDERHPETLIPCDDLEALLRIAATRTAVWSHNQNYDDGDSTTPQQCLVEALKELLIEDLEERWNDWRITFMKSLGY